MSRSLPKTVKIPVPLLEAVEQMRKPGGPMDGYPAFNSAVIGLVLYAALFPRRHDLTMEISRLHPDDQDLIHDFAADCIAKGRTLSETLPKPATAKSIIKLAREWKAGALD